MAKYNARAEVVDRCFEDDQHVGGGMIRAAATDHRPGDDLGAAIGESRPEFLVRQVAEVRMEEAKGFGAAADRVAVRVVIGEPLAPPQLHRGDNRDSLRLANATKSHQLVDGQAGEPPETVIDRAEDTLRELHGRFAAATGSDQDRDQLGVTQCSGPLEPHFLARPIFLGQLLDAQPVVHCAQSLRVTNGKCLLRVIDKRGKHAYAPLVAPLYIIGIGRRRASLHATRIGSVLGVDLDHIPFVDEERHAHLSA